MIFQLYIELRLRACESRRTRLSAEIDYLGGATERRAAAINELDGVMMEWGTLMTAFGGRRYSVEWPHLV